VQDPVALDAVALLVEPALVPERIAKLAVPGERDFPITASLATSTVWPDPVAKHAATCRGASSWSSRPICLAQTTGMSKPVGVDLLGRSSSGVAPELGYCRRPGGFRHVAGRLQLRRGLENLQRVAAPNAADGHAIRVSSASRRALTSARDPHTHSPRRLPGHSERER